MTRRTEHPARVSRLALRKGFEMAVSNGFSLVMSAVLLVEKFPQVALGLAQLGQEEIGKSLSILAAVGLRDDDAAWQGFWKAWRDHKVKSHRAFIYEMFSPLRLELKTPSGKRLAGQPYRSSMPAEKEASFYVNFDPSTSSFVLPDDDVKTDEVLNRVMSAGYLAQKAYAVHRALEADDSEFRYAALSEVALRITAEDLFQQDMPDIFEEICSRSPRHAALVQALETAFAEEKDFWQEMIAVHRSSSNRE